MDGSTRRSAKRRHTRRALKFLLFRTGSLLTLLAVIVIFCGFLYLSLDVNKDLVEKNLSEQIKRPVTIESIQTGWSGWFADVTAEGVRVKSIDGTQSSLRVGRLALSVDPMSMLTGEFSIERIVVEGLTLELRWHDDGSLQIGDVVISKEMLARPGPLRWLLRQRHAEIRNSTFVWIDSEDPYRSLPLREAGLLVRNDESGGTRFVGQGRLGQDEAARIEIRGSAGSPPLPGTAWNGEVDIKLTGLPLAQLPAVFKESIPRVSNGDLAADIQTQWRVGSLRSADADVVLSDLAVAEHGDTVWNTLEGIKGNVSWRRADAGWQLSVGQPELMVQGRPLRAESMGIDRDERGMRYSVDDVSVDDLMMLAESSRWLAQSLPTKLRPGGRFDEISIQTSGPWRSPREWRVEGRFANLHWLPAQGFPGVDGFDGTFSIGPAKGSMRIDSGDLQLAIPGTGADPLEFDTARADITWQLDKDQWLVEIDDLALAGPGIEGGSGRLSLMFDPEHPRSSRVDGEFTVGALPVNELVNHLPGGLVPQKARTWLRSSLQAGRFTDARIKLSGTLDRFPYRDGDGLFSLHATVEQGVLNYAAGWPRLEEVFGSVSFSNAIFESRLFQAKMGQSVVKAGSVNSPDLFRRNGRLRIESRLRSPVQEVIEFLTEGPLSRNPSPPLLTGAGDGELRLDLDMPLRNIKEEVKVQGSFSTDDGSVTIAERLTLNGINGTVDFTENSVHATDVEATLLGGPVSIQLETTAPGRPPQWQIDARGTADPASLVAWITDTGISTKVTGQTDWSATFAVGPDVQKLRLVSDLVGTEIGLPAPLGKASGGDRPFTMEVDFTDETHDYQFEFSPLRGRFVVTPDADHDEKLRGAVSVGKQNLPTLPRTGVGLSIAQTRLDADAWLELLTPESGQAGAGPPAAPILRNIEMRVDDLRFFHRDLGEAFVKASSSNGRAWTAWVSAAAASGRVDVDLRNDAPDTYRATFDHLRLPEREGTTATQKSSGFNPDLHIIADRFAYGGRKLGAMELRAKGYVGRWRIDKLSMDQPGLRIEADGHWAYGPGGSTTQIRASLDSDDIEVALERLGFPPHVAGEGLQLNLSLEWPGNPQGFVMDSLQGSFELVARDGRFLNLDPGSGRLLGLFNVDAISRRLSLDFSDIFSKGLAFDRIEGRGRIDDGDIISEGVYVIAPAALIDIEGRTGFLAEDYDLEITIAPQLSAQISMLSALANPIAGAMVFLAQQVFKEKLSKMVQYQYTVTGSWELPEITAVTVEPVSETESER